MSPSKSRRRISHKKKSSNKKIMMIVALLAVVAVATVGYVMLGNSSLSNSSSNSSSDNLPSTNKVMLVTSMGNIMIELRDDMPITTNNFKKLVQQGVYDNTIFHRVIDGFMIQGGDPATGAWTGGAIPNIKDEFTDNNKNDRGTIAMAKESVQSTGQIVPDSGSSQFFINVVNNNYLDGDYSIFGKVTEGMDVVDAIAKVATDGNNRPLADVTILTADFVY
jgi:peptidylprolyl isomerase